MKGDYVSSEANDLIKQARQTLGLKQGELAETMGVSPESLRRWARSGLPLHAQKHVQLLLELHECRQRLAKFEELIEVNQKKYEF